MPFADSGSSRIHYVLDGPSSAPFLVFSNSLGTTLTMWENQAHAFQGKFRVLRYDTRGHGNSSVPSGPCSVEQLGQDVISLLDHLRLERVHFCGLSIGGMIGMWLGSNAPSRLHSLTLSNTAAKIGTAEMWNARIETVRKNGMQAIGPSVMERWFTSNFRAKQPAAVSAMQRIVEATNPEGYVACCAAVRDFDFRQQLGSIRVPTLVISGAYDPATTPSDGKFLTQGITKARYVELNAAHLSNIEDRDAFNAALGNFLS